MEYLLEGLARVARQDGNLYYCFSEVKIKLFSEIPSGTLKTWIRWLEISKEKCSLTEHNFFKSKLPDIAVGAFKLISEQHLLKLLSHKISRTEFQRQQVVSSKCISDCTMTPLRTCTVGQTTSTSSFDNINRSERSPVEQPQNGGLQSFQSPFESCKTKYDSTLEGNLPLLNHVSFSNIDRSLTSTAPSQSLVNTCPITFPATFLGPRPVVFPVEQTPSFNNVNEFVGAQNNATAPCPEKISESTELSRKPHRNVSDEFQSFETGAQNNNASAAATLVLDSDSDLESTHKNAFKFRKRDSRILPISELSESAAKEMSDFRLFYTKTLNTQRRGAKLEDSTMNKAVERILAFYKFLKHSKRLEPGLKYFEDEKLLEQFASYLLDPEQRGLKSVTVSRYMSTFLYAIRFLNREKSHKVQDDLLSVSHLKSLRNQLEQRSRTEQHLSGKSNSSKPVIFEEILQVTRDLLFEFEETSTRIAKARALMELCLLLLYTTLSPGRCKEFATLQIVCESEVGELGGNVLLVGAEKLTLITNDYKTKKFYGTDRTELDEDHLVYYLRLYVHKFRSKLLQGNQHKYFLVNYHGQPFSVPALGKYIGSFFEKHCNVRLGIKDLRHSIVTYFLGLPESNENKELSESMACLMRHSVRSQRRHYDCRSRDVRKQPALNFLKRKSIGAVFGGSDNEDIGSSRSDTDEEGFKTANPCAGDFVALVAKNSTARQPEVFIGKVLRFSHDKKDVLLAHLDEVQENHFKVVVGKSYWERKNSLVYPIDLTYLPSDGMYQLRSSKSELHQNVFSK